MRFTRSEDGEDVPDCTWAFGSLVGGIGVSSGRISELREETDPPTNRYQKLKSAYPRATLRFISGFWGTRKPQPTRTRDVLISDRLKAQINGSKIQKAVCNVILK